VGQIFLDWGKLEFLTFLVSQKIQILFRGRRYICVGEGVFVWGYLCWGGDICMREGVFVWEKAYLCGRRGICVGEGICAGEGVFGWERGSFLSTIFTVGL
jgi:hypothetical protein